MKKFVFALVAALPLAFAACGDEENDEPNVLTINETSVTLDYDGNVTLTASEKGCEWSSDNEFVASVDKKGKVVANHVGSAKISASKDGQRATCTITVVPTVKSFVQPIINWSFTQQDVISMMSNAQWRNLHLTKVDMGDDDVLGYETEEGDYLGYTYYFVDNILDNSCLSLDVEERNNLTDFLRQCYNQIDNPYPEAHPYSIYFVDGTSLSDADLAVRVDADFDVNIASATYKKIDHVTRSVSDVFNTPAVEKTLKAIKNHRK